MQRSLLVVLAVLVLATPAQGKGPVRINLCGAEGCASVSRAGVDGSSSRAAPGLLDLRQLELASAPLPGPYYEIRLGADWLGDRVMFYVPSGDVLREGSIWYRLDRRSTARLRDAAEGLEPWYWTGLQEAKIGNRKVEHPGAYEALIGSLRRAESPPYDATRIPIVLTSWIKRAEHQLTPWTNLDPALEWYPGYGVVYREGEWLRLPPGFGKLLASDAGFVVPSRAPPTNVPWALAAGAVGACVLAVAAGLFLVARVRRQARLLPY